MEIYEDLHPKSNKYQNATLRARFQCDIFVTTSITISIDVHLNTVPPRVTFAGFDFSGRKASRPHFPNRIETKPYEDNDSMDKVLFHSLHFVQTR